MGEDATGSTTAAPRGVEHGSRQFPCPACGADLEFHIGAQNLKCPFCGHLHELADDERGIAEQDLGEMLQRLADRRSRDVEGVDEEIREVDCPSCGATARFTGSLTAGECAWCGSPLQVDGVHDAQDRVPVDGVLPFQIERDSARERLATWVKSLWFAPNALRRRGVQGRFEGVYSPYWTFDSLTFTRFSGARGEHYWVTVGSGKKRRRQRRTRWYPVSGSFQRFFDDVLAPASTALPEKWTRRLEPWPLDRCVPFDPRLLAGFLARTYDVELADGFGDARKRIDRALRADVRARIGGDTQRVDTVETSHDAVTFKHLLLPLWLLTFRYKDRAYRVLINAATGEIQGDRPWSWVKILLAALAGIAVGGVILFMLSR